MANTILGIFDDPLAARHAMEALRESPLKLDDISVVSRATESGAAVGNRDDVTAGEGAAVGAVWGGLVGLAALLIPGIGPFIAFGALGAALTGALTGAVVGGISAALIDFGGIPEAEARGYEQQVHAGKTLVAVKAREEDAIEVRRILAAAGAASIRDNQTDISSAANSAVHVAMYDASGRHVNEAIDYGAPANPATGRRGIDNMPKIDRGANLTSPVVEGEPPIDSAGQVQPRESSSGVVDTTRTDVTTPETLDATTTTEGDNANRKT